VRQATAIGKSCEAASSNPPGTLFTAAGVGSKMTVDKLGVAPRLDSVSCALRGVYAPIADRRSKKGFVLGQLGQSLDGRIAAPSGQSPYINGPQAIAHLHRLRALVDGVIVGIGTVLSDDPQLTVRQVAGPNPARIVIDPNGRLPSDAKLLAEDGVPVYTVQYADQWRPSRVCAITLASRDGRIDPFAIVAGLAQRGLHRLLVEGGKNTLSNFLAARALDRLHVCVAPLRIGSGPRGLDLPLIERYAGDCRPDVSVHRLGEDVLYDFAFPRSRPKAAVLG
jgi:diaminohydroxyphosphoribosylaminopyrimidine deaminase / 5-amino-6-(5-phosphoribosylamino)uracil reductase